MCVKSCFTKYFNYIDIDECSTGDYSCAQNQQCVNRPGTFICVCVSGYELLNGVCKGNSQLANLVLIR